MSDYTTLSPLATSYRITRGQRSRAAGWRKPANGVCCDRSSRWGNPNRVTAYTDAHKACVYFAIDLITPEAAERHAYLAPLVTRWRESRSLVVLCWCAPNAPCHCVPLGDALALELQRLGVAP